ncbi:hypothetical protein PV08_01623 [Exophiala spinifera]|uniref:Uncharacterized protein n=1 Tax=Exophiala spinifera TaxID=91928 RepID=A0A0D2CC53_9EURO|nr:uncharacterized protein PV08_01623 [Exophiala spinifera]KIW21044.1 hypothetical protein PV08_01623 [Exophiala spinifera]
MPSRRVVGVDRRNPCTHIKMTRLFDPYGSFRCSMCHKHPSIGWLYRCTLDSHGFLPESDFTGTPAPCPKIDDPMDVSGASVNTTIIKTMGQGILANEEVVSLPKQKDKVNGLLLEQEHRPETSYSATTDTSTADSSVTDRTFSTLPQSASFSTTSSTSLDEEIRAAYDWNELQKVWMSEPTLVLPSSPRPAPAVLAEQRSEEENEKESEDEKDRDAENEREGGWETVNEEAVQTCNLMVCPTCRPTYRDRAYWALDDVLNGPVQCPPIWEWENRRLSDARILMGIRSAQSERASSQPASSPTESVQSRLPVLREEEMDEVDNVQPQPQPEPEPEPEPDGEESSRPETDAHSVRKRSGFRETVRKVLARARLEDTCSGSNNNINTTATDASDASDQEMATDRPGSLIFRRRQSRCNTLSFVQRHGRVVDTSVLQESVTLMLARNTPVPTTPRIETSQSGGAVGSINSSSTNNNINAADVISQA